MRCQKCFAEIPNPTSFCLYCGHKNAMGCGVFVEDKRISIIFIGKNVIETLSFKIYEEEQSLKNLFEVIAEKIHERRVDEVYVSGIKKELIDNTVEMLKIYSLYPITCYITNTFSSLKDFTESLEKHVKAVKELKKVNIKPEDKIQGSHSTIIGGREGLRYIRKIATSEYVKKIVPGVIEAKGSAVGGGVRFKLTRCDDRGNIRGLLIDGASVQEIHIITTAKNKEEGEAILKILRGIIEEE